MGVETQSMEAILKTLIRKKGLDYLRSGSYFVNAFEELGGPAADSTLLRYLVQSGGHIALLDAEGQTPAMRQTIYSQTVKKICDRTLISPELSCKVCGAFWRAVYDEEPPVRFVPEPKPAPEKNSKKKTEAGKETDTKPFPKKWILLGIGLLAVLVCLVLSGITDSRSGEDLPWDAQLPKAISGYAVDADILSLVEAGTEDTYAYQDGAHLAMYFDEAGNERCRIYVNSENNVEYVFTAEYDKDGNILTHKTFNQAGTLIRTDLLAYDSVGNTIEERILLEGDALAETTLRIYDEEDRFVSAEIRAGDGTVLYSAQSEYDEEGQATYSGWYYDGSNYESRYDADGNCISAVWGDGGTVTSSTEYTYPSDGSTAEKTTYYTDGSVSGSSTRITQYDIYGSRTEEEIVQYDTDGAVEYSIQTKYDSDGKEIKQIRYDADGTQRSVRTNLYGPRGLKIGSVTQIQAGSSTSESLESLESILGTSVKEVGITSGENGGTYIITYNVMGDMTQSVNLDENGNMNYLAEWEINDYGCNIQYTFTGYNEEGNVDYLSVTEYNEFGKQLRGTLTVYRYDGSYTVTKTDANGETISQLTYDADGKLTELK